MPDKRQTIRAAFLQAAFSSLGYIASCDGPINRDEVNRLKIHMKKMHLAEDEQRHALHLFKSATAPDFNASQMLQEFRAATTPKLIQILIVHLLTMARADGYLMEKELHALQWIAHELGYHSVVFNHLLRMIYEQDQLALSLHPPQPTQPDNYSAPSWEPKKAQKTKQKKEPPKTHSPIHTYTNTHTHTHRNTSNNINSGTHNQDLLKAYAILGVTADMTEDEIRRSYKKLASQLHPDKLLSQGLPQDQINATTEGFKQIQAAYAFIKKYRSIYTVN